MANIDIHNFRQLAHKLIQRAAARSQKITIVNYMDATIYATHHYARETQIFKMPTGKHIYENCPVQIKTINLLNDYTEQLVQYLRKGSNIFITEQSINDMVLIEASYHQYSSIDIPFNMYLSSLGLYVVDHLKEDPDLSPVLGCRTFIEKG